MSKILITLAAIGIAGAAMTNASFAGVPNDPHQRAREFIVAPPASPVATPRGAMGRLIDESDYVDAHARARLMIRDEQWPPISARQQVASGQPGVGHADAQRRARSIFLGEPI